MSNNYSTVEFWRSWHSSFNLWIIRYIYIPLGGSKNVFWNIWIIFAFAALWHSFSWEMVLWGFLIALSILPEQICKWMLKNGKFGQDPPKILALLGGSFNIICMIIANIVGYGLEWPKAKNLFSSLFKEKRIGLIDCTIVISILCCTVQVMKLWESQMQTFK